MKFSQWLPLSRLAMIKSREFRKFYERSLGGGMVRDRDADGDCGIRATSVSFLRQLSNDFGRDVYAFRWCKGESGNRVSPILLPVTGIDGLSFRYFPWPRLFFLSLFLLKIELSIDESTETFSKSGRFRDPWRENSVAIRAITVVRKSLSSDDNMRHSYALRRAPLSLLYYSLLLI